MKILHITPHLGGGVGTVIMDWMEQIQNVNGPIPRIMCLDYANEKSKKKARELHQGWFGIRELMIKQHRIEIIEDEIRAADIVLVHYWDHKMLADLFAEPIPDCRMAFWVHKNYPFDTSRLPYYPDRFIVTSPIQGRQYDYIWSTGNMDRFLAIEPKPHQGFNIGYVGTVTHKKIHANVLRMCHEIIKVIPDARFTFVGDCESEWKGTDKIRFTGPVDDVAPYLAEMDVFGYPLRSDHYGTCEIALGEAMAAGVVPVVMRNLAEKEIINSHVNGLVAEDEQDYVECVEFLYKRQTERELMSLTAKYDAERRYSIDTMIQQWNNVFNEMIQIPKTRKETL